MKGVWWMLRFDARLRVDTIAPDEYFPAANAHATWQRREPFFKLSGRVPWEPERVQMELRQFTDRHLNRDLAALYRWVGAAKPRLPDGRQRIFTTCGSRSLTLDDHREPLA